MVDVTPADYERGLNIMFCFDYDNKLDIKGNQDVYLNKTLT